MIQVVADDLTGAAECAAVGFRLGLNAEVHTLFDADSSADLVSLDTNTRSLPKLEAGARTLEVCSGLSRGGDHLVFKKVDSILRGAVLEEVSAVAKVLALKRVLLVPANPLLGRVVVGGHYYIDTQPIHETDFARDPEHPILSSGIDEMLGGTPDSRKIHLRPPDGTLPPDGVVVGEAATTAHLVSWAKRLDDRTLPAGAAEFLAAVLLTRPGLGGNERVPRLDLDDFPRTLFVSGSSSSYSRQFSQYLEENGIPVYRAPKQLLEARDLPDGLIEAQVRFVSDSLRSIPLVRVCIDLPLRREPSVAQRLTLYLTRLVKEILNNRTVDHLCVEGGDTISALVRSLGWSKLSVLDEWAPGVVALQPVASKGPILTSKPGSYRWPRRILALIKPEIH